MTEIDLQVLTSIRVLMLTGLAFLFTMAWTPILTHYLFKFKLGKQIRTAGAPVFASLHKGKQNTPTMGGVLVWGTTLILALLFWVLAQVDGPLFAALNFLSRRETALPLGALVISAVIGLADDLMGILRIGPNGGGLRMVHKIILYTLIAAGGAWWFYQKLDWHITRLPFTGAIYDIGIWYIFFAMTVIIATSFSTNETDGLDGLAGGVLLISFASYGVIAFVQDKPLLATFCGILVGSLLAFLWFNVHPARFFMGDTGAMSLGVTLAVLALFTDTVWLLPLLAFVLVIESLSVIVQTLSKKIRGKKIFLSTPIHHHLEAIGWPETKITMRFWIVSGVMASLGLALFFIERALTLASL